MKKNIIKSHRDCFADARNDVHKGFTLFELLVSISIIAILTAIAIVSYSGAQKKARDARRIQDIDAVGKALESYYSDESDYPEGIDDLTSYLQQVPTDPKPPATYNYVIQGTSYCLCADMEDATRGNYGDVACGVGAGFYCRKGQQE